MATNKGIAPLALVIIVAALLAGGGYTAYRIYNKEPLLVATDKVSTPHITETMLKSATLSYPSPYADSIKSLHTVDTVALVDGHARLSDEGKDSLGGENNPRVYDIATTATGDLNGDGVPEGIIGLYQGWGANWIIPIIFVLSNKNGVLTQIDSTPISFGDDRTSVQSLSIQNGILSVNLLVLSEADKNLAHYLQKPTVKKTVQFKLVAGELVLQDTPVTIKDWKTYANKKYAFEFKYPSVLSETQKGETVTLSHSIPYKHPDPCDFKGDEKTNRPKMLDRLTDFDISFSVVNQNLKDLVQSTDYPGWEYVSKNPYMLGSLNGFKVSQSIEGCGKDVYYFTLSATKTLVVNRTLTEFNQGISILPGVITPRQSDDFFERIVTTVTLTK